MLTLELFLTNPFVEEVNDILPEQPLRATEQMQHQQHQQRHDVIYSFWFLIQFSVQCNSTTSACRMMNWSAFSPSPHSPPPTHALSSSIRLRTDVIRLSFSGSLQTFSTIENENENALTQNGPTQISSVAIVGGAFDSSSNGNYANDITNANCVTEISRRALICKPCEPTPRHVDAAAAYIESMIENVISNANCNVDNTECNTLVDDTVNDVHRQQQPPNEIGACSLAWLQSDDNNDNYNGYRCQWYFDDGDADDDDDDTELTAGNTTNRLENGASQQHNFSSHHIQTRKNPIDKAADADDTTHKLWAKSNDVDDCAAIKQNGTNNNAIDRYKYDAFHYIPPTMIQRMCANCKRIFLFWILVFALMINHSSRVRSALCFVSHSHPLFLQIWTVRVHVHSSMTLLAIQ